MQKPTCLPKLVTHECTATQNSKSHEWNSSPKSSSNSSRNSSFLTTPLSSSNSHSGHSAASHQDYAHYLTYGPTRHSQERAITRQHGTPEYLVPSRNPTPFVKRQARAPSAGRVADTLTSTKKAPVTTSNREPCNEEGKSLDQVGRGCARRPLNNDAPSSIPFPKARRRASSSYSIAGLSRSSSGASRAGSKLGPQHFLVTRKVGTGGFGCVYEGIEVQSGHVVAIKTISRQGLTRHRVDAVLKEQVISKRVSENRSQPDASGNGSEFVVRMVSSFLTPSHFVFVLEYHGAGDLRDVDFPLKTAVARFYISEMALGLRYLHSMNIVLRDLKPANALLGFDGHVRLADFGLATITEPAENDAENQKRKDSRVREQQPNSILSFATRARSGSLRSMTDSLRLSNIGFGNGRKRSNTSAVPANLTRAASWGLGRGSGYKRPQPQTVLCGTPGYIAPEGYQGKHGPEGDIWALGITLFEFITGVNPFDTWGEPTREIKTKVQNSKPFYPEGMPKETRSVLEKLLHKNWKKRMTLDGMMVHPFFNADGFSWESLQKRGLSPPPLPEAARERLQRASKPQSCSRDLPRRPEMPLILYLEHESMAVHDGDTFREELTGEETRSFYMDGVHNLPQRIEENDGSSSDLRIW